MLCPHLGAGGEARRALQTSAPMWAGSPLEGVYNGTYSLSLVVGVHPKVEGRSVSGWCVKCVPR